MSGSNTIRVKNETDSVNPLTPLLGQAIMTAFTTGQLPSGDAAITTVEGLKLWCDLILKANAGKEEIIRQEGELAVSVNRLNFYTDRDGLQRCECVSQIRLNEGWETSGDQPWTEVIPFNNVAIPSRFSGS
jgi:hypothetical protein